MDRAQLETIRLRSENSWDFRRMRSFDGVQAAEDRRDLLAYIAGLEARPSVGVIQAMAERAFRHGYDLDPAEVLETITGSYPSL